MSKKREILEAINRGSVLTALLLIADGIDEGDNATVAAAAAAAASAAATANAAAASANAAAAAAASANATQQAELDDHEARITALEP